MSEFNYKQRGPTKEWDENYDRIFKHNYYEEIRNKGWSTITTVVDGQVSIALKDPNGKVIAVCSSAEEAYEVMQYWIGE